MLITYTTTAVADNDCHVDRHCFYINPSFRHQSGYGCGNSGGGRGTLRPAANTTWRSEMNYRHFRVPHVRHVRGVRPNRAAKFRGGGQFWTLQKLTYHILNDYDVYMA